MRNTRYVEIMNEITPITPTLLEGAIGDAIRVCEVAAPTGREERRAELVIHKLRNIGWTVERDGAGNVLAYWNQRPTKPLIVMAHLDTVHVGIKNIKVARDENVLQGPGIGDNSMGVAALLYLARAFRGHQGPLLLAATVAEESVGNLRGALEAVEDWNPSEVIALEGAGVEHLITSGPGSIRYRISLHGQGGHSWEDRSQASATHALVEILSQIGEEQSCESWNIGKISGGGIVSARAAEASAEIEFRDHSAEKLENAKQIVDQALQNLPKGLTGQKEMLGRRPGGRTSQDHPLVQSALKIREQYGLSQECAAVSTDANAGYGAGIPSLCVGLTHGELLHTQQEWCDVSRLEDSLNSLAQLVWERTSAI